MFAPLIFAEVKSTPKILASVKFAFSKSAFVKSAFCKSASVKSEFFKLTEYRLLPLKLTFFREFSEKSDPTKFDSSKLVSYRIASVSYTHLTLPTTPYV